MTSFKATLNALSLLAWIALLHGVAFGFYYHVSTPVTVVAHFAVESQSVDEDQGDISLVIFLDQETDREVRVPFDVEAIGDHAALEGKDFRLKDKYIVIAAGEKSGTIRFEPVNDRIREPEGETTTLVLRTVPGVKLSKPDRLTLSIRDPYQPPLSPLKVRLIAEKTNWSEDAGTIPIILRLSDPARKAIVGSIRVSGSTDDEDRRLSETSFSIQPGTVELPLHIDITDDQQHEPHETIELALDVSSNEILVASPLRLIIEDDDLPQVRLDTEQTKVNAAAADQIEVRTILSSPARRDLELPYTLVRQPDDANERHTSEGVFYFRTNVSESLIKIPVVATKVESDETLTISLPVWVSVEKANDRTLGIHLERQKDVILKLAASSPQIVEGASNAIVITARLATRAKKEVSIRCKLTGNAYPRDVQLNGALKITIPAGGQDGNFSFFAVHDKLDEDEEQLRVSVDGIKIGLREMSSGESVTVAIKDHPDDKLPSLGVAVLDADGSLVTETFEDDGQDLTLVFRLNQASGRDVDFAWTLSGTAGTDRHTLKIPVDGQKITIPAGEREHRLAFKAKANKRPEDNQKLVVSIHNGTNVKLVDKYSKTTFFIQDDDDDTLILLLLSPELKNGYATTKEELVRALRAEDTRLRLLDKTIWLVHAGEQKGRVAWNEKLDLDKYEAFDSNAINTMLTAADKTRRQFSKDRKRPLVTVTLLKKINAKNEGNVSLPKHDGDPHFLIWFGTSITPLQTDQFRSSVTNVITLEKYSDTLLSKQVLSQIKLGLKMMTP